MSGIVHGLPEELYHASPALSSTGVKRLLESPARFQHERKHHVERRVYDFGKIVHALVLGEGARFKVLDFADRRTNAYKDAENAARIAGLVPILAKDYENAAACANRVLADSIAGSLFTDGAAEVSAFARHARTGTMRRARADWLRNDGLIIDLKTTGTSAEPTEQNLGKTIAKYGYHTSGAWYSDVFTDCGVDVRGFVLVFVETDAPHLVSVAQIDPQAIELGRAQCERALDIYDRAVATNHWADWPEADDHIHLIDVPAWAYRQGAAA